MALAMAVLLFVAGAGYRYHVRRLLALERVRTQIATDQLDDIGSSLSHIAILSEVARQRGACIVCDQPYLYFARVTQLWKRTRVRPAGPRIHPSAVIDPDAVVDPTAVIGPLCVIERGARIGAEPG